MMNQLTASDPTVNQGLPLRLILLASQSFSLGVTLALLLVTGNALFLTTFGAQALPYVYITVAILGSLVSYGLATLQKRWSLSQLAITAVTGLVVFYFLAWVSVSMRWVAFGLVVSFAFLVQIGFVFLGGQAGRLLDVRQIKRLFPQIVAGFVFGFVVGALLVPPLVTLLGRIENLLLAITGSAFILLMLLVITNWRFHGVLNQRETSSRSRPGKSLRQLLSQRFVLLIFLYQMLYTVVNQLSDFILLAQAGTRYADSAGLAHFFSNFSVLLNGIDLVFLLFIAGYLLNRFGLYAGLLSNPVVTSLLFLALLITGITVGPTTTLFFVLVVVTRITNITLADGNTRGSVNASYQALPAQERALTQTAAEGIGAPLALGLVGIILLIFNAISGLTILHVVFLTLVMAVLWGVTGALVYRDYAAALLQGLRRRTLGDGSLSLADSSSLTVVENLLQSGRLSDIRLGLETLATAEHPSLDTHLLQLATHPDASIRTEALAWMERRTVRTARPLISQAVKTETDPAAKGAVVRALCAVDEADAMEQVTPYLSDPEPDVCLGAMVGLLRYGGVAGVLAAGERLTALAASPHPEERCFVARVIGEVASPGFYQPLLALLLDDDQSVRQTALAAAGQVRHPRLLPLIAANLAQPATRSAAIAALIAYSEAVLPLVETEMARQADSNHQNVIRLLRVCAQVGGERTINLLKPYICHADDEVRSQVLAVLSACGYQAGGEAATAVTQALQHEAEQALHILVTQQDIGEEEGVQMLKRALESELDLIRRRVLLLLSFRHEAHAILRAGERLAATQEIEKALALEMLDVTLTAPEKAILFPLADPRLTLAQRIQQLGRLFPISHLDRDERLRHIIANPDGIWQHTWTRACAIYAAGKLGLRSAIEAITMAATVPDAVVQETAAWALGELAKGT